jgi:hypothetical protein
LSHRSEGSAAANLAGLSRSFSQTLETLLKNMTALIGCFLSNMNARCSRRTGRPTVDFKRASDSFFFFFSKLDSTLFGVDDPPDAIWPSLFKIKDPARMTKSSVALPTDGAN